MRLTRVYVTTPLAPGKRVVIPGSAASHIARVLRLGVGAPLTLFDGLGGEYRARIEELGRESVAAAVLEKDAIERQSPLPLTLAQGVSRSLRMDWILQKATELGIWRIVPLLTERSVVRLDAMQAQRKMQHWRAVTVAACEQCGRNLLPELASPLELHEFLTQREPTATYLLLSPTGVLRIEDVIDASTGLTILIGPEGGLADSEQEAAIAAGYKPVRLGPRVLRTETAAVAALAILQRELGDL